MKKYLILFLLPIFSSCEKAFFKEETKSEDALENFDYLWQQCDRNYAFFTYKNIDWQAVKTNYRSKVYVGMTNDSLFSVMAAMLRELKDGHVNLISSFNISRFNIDLLGADNYSGRVIQDNYLLDKTYNTTGAFDHNFIANKTIGYIRYSSFSDDFTEDNIAYIIDKYKDAKGIVFDIRQNGGGSAANIYKFLSHFTRDNVSLWTAYSKTGAGHDDFGNPIVSNLKPSTPYYSKKLIVLTDRGSFSASSFFTLSAKELDNVLVIGDTTGGGLGMPNGGQLPNGWTYRCSITETLSNNGENFENGVPPDITVVNTPQDFANGIDVVLDRAILELQ